MIRTPGGPAGVEVELARDFAAAAFISFEIIDDGWANLRNAVAQLMNKRPSDIESQQPDPVIHKLQDALRHLPWVKDASARLRGDGDIMTGEAFVVPRDDRELLDRVEQATAVANSVDWRLHDINVGAGTVVRQVYRGGTREHRA